MGGLGIPAFRIPESLHTEGTVWVGARVRPTAPPAPGVRSSDKAAQGGQASGVQLDSWGAWVPTVRIPEWPHYPRAPRQPLLASDEQTGVRTPPVAQTHWRSCPLHRPLAKYPTLVDAAGPEPRFPQPWAPLPFPQSYPRRRRAQPFPHGQNPRAAGVVCLPAYFLAGCGFLGLGVDR